jgi:hypothetical protein
MRYGRAQHPGACLEICLSKACRFEDGTGTCSTSTSVFSIPLTNSNSDLKWICESRTATDSCWSHLSIISFLEALIPSYQSWQGVQDIRTQKAGRKKMQARVMGTANRAALKSDSMPRLTSKIRTLRLWLDSVSVTSAGLLKTCRLSSLWTQALSVMLQAQHRHGKRVL